MPNKFPDLEEDFIHGVSDEERKRRRGVMDQRSGEGLKKKWQQEDREALDVAAKQMAPPVITEPRCHVCQSDFRFWIERMLVKGLSYSSIARSLPEESVDRKSISHHFSEHMRLEDASVRAQLEEEADLLQQNYEEGVRGAFTQRGALDVLIRKAFDDAMNNVTTVEPRDMIQMIKAYNEMDTNTGTTAREEAMTAIRIFMTAIQNVLIRGDLIERELGLQLMEGIGAEVENLRSEEEIETKMERYLLPQPQR